MKKLFFLIIVIVLSFLIGAGFSRVAFREPVPTSTPEPKQEPTLTPIPFQGLNSDKLWSLIQEWRQSQGLSPYIKDQRLCKIAELRAPEVNAEKIPHAGFLQRYSTYPYVLSENIVYDSISENLAFDKWLNSASHAATLRANYIYSCVATDKDDAVQIFSNLEP